VKKKNAPAAALTQHKLSSYLSSISRWRWRWNNLHGVKAEPPSEQEKAVGHTKQPLDNFGVSVTALKKLMRLAPPG
jgi:hypothetical protein